jgi:hypothetical protein
MLLRPVGLAIAAPLASVVGVSNSILIFAGISLTVILALLVTPVVWNMQLEPELTENS